MRHHVILIEQGPDNLSAYIPSLPGCITTGKTRKEIIDNMVEAISLHLDSMALDGDPIPDEGLEAMVLVVPEPNPDSLRSMKEVGVGVQVKQ